MFTPTRSARRCSVVVIILATTALGLLAGCGRAFPADGKPRIIAAAFPFAWVSEQIGGDHVHVRNLTQPGSEPHDVELTPHQVAAVQDADILVYERHFQPSVDNAVDQAGRPAATTIDVAGILELRHNDTVHDHGAGHDHHHDHDHGPYDPHVWLDPNNMVTIAEALTERMVRTDPANASFYQARSRDVIEELDSLDGDFRSGLARCQRSLLVTSHAAFGYMADRYGLAQEAIAGIDPNNEPSPAQLAKITRLVHHHSIRTIFTERLASQAVANTIAAETGAHVARLNPLETALPDQSYLRLMRKNLATIQKANGCS